MRTAAMRRASVIVLALVAAVFSGCSGEEKKQEKKGPLANPEPVIREHVALAADDLAAKAKALPAMKVAFHPAAVKNELRTYFDEKAATKDVVEKLRAAGTLEMVELAEGAKVPAGHHVLKGRVTSGAGQCKVALDLWDPRTGESAAVAMKTFSVQGESGESLR